MYAAMNMDDMDDVYLFKLTEKLPCYFPSDTVIIWGRLTNKNFTFTNVLLYFYKILSKQFKQ